MNTTQRYLKGFATAGADTPLLMAIRHLLTGAYIKQADLESISVKAGAWDNPTVLTLDVEDVGKEDAVRDTLQKLNWTQNNIGWNAIYVLPGSAIPSGGEYAVEFEFVYADGKRQPVLWRLDVEARRLS